MAVVGQDCILSKTGYKPVLREMLICSLSLSVILLWGGTCVVAEEMQRVDLALRSPESWEALEVAPTDEVVQWVTPTAELIDLPIIVQTASDPLLPDPVDLFRGHRVENNSLDWIVGDGDQFGMFSLGSDHYLGPRETSGFGVGVGLHWLGGPERTDLPPRMYNFSLGYQRRHNFGGFGYDVAAAVMASSDFEGSSREGIQFPCHAVGFISLSSSADLVLGADYLDRRDIKLLPVAGIILRPHRALRLELVFPTPRVDIRLSEKHSLFFSGALGGGTWAVERDSLLDDLVTYRDLRAAIGVETNDAAGNRSAIEIAFLFDRKLEYASGLGDYRPNETVMIRSVSTY